MINTSKTAAAIETNWGGRRPVFAIDLLFGPAMHRLVARHALLDHAATGLVARPWPRHTFLGEEIFSLA